MGMGAIRINVISLIKNIFINNDIDFINFLTEQQEIFRAPMLREMYALACRYSNLNTVLYFHHQIAELSDEIYISSICKIYIFNLIVERTDDNVEILDAVCSKVKIANSIDLINKCINIALQCDNVKMAEYLKKLIS
jgi:hypothetical protein